LTKTGKYFSLERKKNGLEMETVMELKIQTFVLCFL